MVRSICDFFNSGRLHNGRAPGAFLLPGIEKANYRCCNAVVSGVVIDWTFTSGGVDVHAHLFVDHCCAYFRIRVLNFHGWSQLRNYFNSEIYLIYGNYTDIIIKTVHINTKYMHVQSKPCTGNVWSKTGECRSERWKSMLLRILPMLARCHRLCLCQMAWRNFTIAVFHFTLLHLSSSLPSVSWSCKAQ